MRMPRLPPGRLRTRLPLSRSNSAPVSYSVLSGFFSLTEHFFCTQYEADVGR